MEARLRTRPHPQIANFLHDGEQQTREAGAARVIELLGSISQKPEPHPVSDKKVKMKDAQQWIERLRKEAEECRLISRLATNKAKRETFARLAVDADRHADEMAALLASGDLNGSPRRDKPESRDNDQISVSNLP